MRSALLIVAVLQPAVGTASSVSGSGARSISRTPEVSSCLSLQLARYQRGLLLAPKRKSAWLRRRGPNGLDRTGAPVSLQRFSKGRLKPRAPASLLQRCSRRNIGANLESSICSNETRPANSNQANANSASNSCSISRDPLWGGPEGIRFASGSLRSALACS